MVPLLRFCCFKAKDMDTILHEEGAGISKVVCVKLLGLLPKFWTKENFHWIGSSLGPYLSADHNYESSKIMIVACILVELD